MPSEQVNIQDQFLNQARRERDIVLITLMSGFKIKCRVKGFDRFSILVESGENEQIIFKHAVSSISVHKSFSNKMRIDNRGEDDEKPDTGI
jgi:host factor-I protein